MATRLLQQKNVIKIGREPMVILPLRKWEEIEGLLEDFEDKNRFNDAYKKSREEKMIELKELKKKYK